jgi:hypothetical protein
MRRHTDSCHRTSAFTAVIEGFFRWRSASDWTIGLKMLLQRNGYYILATTPAFTEGRHALTARITGPGGNAEKC